jgi:hypothetical protein
MQGQWGAPGQSRGYEFTDPQNAVIAKTALGARVLSIILFISAALALVNGNIVNTIISGIVGMFFWKGADSFKSVVDTQGNDVAHMMQALDALTGAFKTRVIVTLIGVGLMILVVLLVLALVLLGVLAS